MIHMEKRDDGVYNCAECDFMRTYDYGKKIYCCDHANRTDDMGKLGVGDLPDGRPEWCPLREK
jgi:hypothetical protein